MTVRLTHKTLWLMLLFAPRIAPNGKTALVLNSGGFSDGVLDDVLVVDLVKNRVIDNVAQVSDGLESLVIHPSGEFAVIACLNAMPWSVTSHLAVISLTPDSAELLYSLPVEALPEGMSFQKVGVSFLWVLPSLIIFLFMPLRG